MHLEICNEAYISITDKKPKLHNLPKEEVLMKKMKIQEVIAFYHIYFVWLQMRVEIICHRLIGNKLYTPKYYT